MQPDAWSSRGLINVWIVEDNADVRQELREEVSAEPDLDAPQAFESGEDLFEFLYEHFAPEVMLVDIGLPGMSGIDVVSRLSRISPATQSIILTIHEDDKLIFDALKAGASGYLLKTAEFGRIPAAVREAHRGGVPMTPQVARRMLNVFTQLQAPREDYGLTEREHDVLKELMSGKTKKEMGKSLFVSEHTIDTHLRNIYSKLHVHSRPGAMAKAHQERLV